MGMTEFQPVARLRGIEKSKIRQMLDRAPAGSINFGLGEPDLPTPAFLRRAAARIVTEEQNGYTTHAGLPALRTLIANDNSQLNATNENVIVTAGSQEALYLALMTLVDEGDEVLLSNPGFIAYPAIIKMAGGKSKFYRLPASSRFRFDVDEFRRALTPQTKVVVCISPSNPTGITMSRADLQAMSKALSDTNIFVISDEIYRELYFTPERPASISEFYPRTLVINGLSKSLNMTGWRLGWLCGGAETADAVRSALVLHGYVTTCASTVSQKTALLTWSDEADASRAEHRQIFHARRDRLLQLLRKELNLNAVAPDGAFYTMVDVSNYGTSMEVAEKFLSHGVITVPGTAFGGEAEGFLRVSFCANEEALREGVRRMKAALS
ncbi:MAG: pyridoxal phosphate-dependent aminotransferase [Pyrinomonadaceae bacterium]